MKKFWFSLSAAALLATVSFGQGGKKIVGDKIVGIVGDKIILQSDIQNALADAARQGGTVPENASCAILEQALVSKVLMLQAQKDSLPVGDDEVEAELDQRVRYFIQQYGDQATLEQVAGKTIYQIKDDARESVKENKLDIGLQNDLVAYDSHDFIGHYFMRALGKCCGGNEEHAGCYYDSLHCSVILCVF